MQPYREAAQEIRSQGEIPLKIAKNVGRIGTAGATAYLGGGAINRVLPFLSKYVPEDLAIKGLNKIDPRFGKFISMALAAGQSFDDVREFIGDKIEDSSEPAKQDRNVIQQYSPELHEFMTSEIQSGRSPLQAGALASLGGKGRDFKDVISKLTKDHKSPWSAIVESVYGTEGVQKTQNNPEQPTQTQGLDPSVASILQQGAAILQRFKGQ